MYWINIKRIMRAGFINFWRNGFVSLASMLVLIVTLFVIGSLVFNNALLRSSMNELRQKVDINVYFTTDAKEEGIFSVKKSIENLPEVMTVTYVSSDEALADFKKRHENDSVTLQALEELGTNPLGAVLNIKTKEPSQYEGVANFLKSNSVLSKGGQSIIDNVNFNKNKVAIDKLTQIIKSSETSNLVRTIFLVLLSFLVSFNTIRLSIYISRDEISVMKLVGASNKYIRGPFVVIGIMYGLISAAITIALFYPVTYWFGPMFYPLPLYFGEQAGTFTLFNYFIGNFWQITAIVVLSGVAMGALSSYVAVKKYLKV